MLEKGEVVIIDTDFIFNECDSNIKYSSAEYKEYEQRYQDEIESDKKR